MDALDYILVPIGVIVLVLYHIYLFLRIKYHPLATVIGFNNSTREAWVSSIREEKKDILAVQSLRNSLMGSSLLATASILVSTTMAAFTLSYNDSPLKHTKNIKLFIIIFIFQLAFFSFMQSIRYINHTNFLINIPSEKSPYVTISYVNSSLSKGMNAYTIGCRFFLLTFVFTLWLFGPIPMLASCLVLTSILFLTDRSGIQPQ